LNTTAPVAALTFLGILLAVLGLFAPAVELVLIGLGAIAVAGIIGVLGTRRA
jgi:hypothetical protein